MSQTPEMLEEKVGILEVINFTKAKTITIEAIRLNSNGTYRYQVKDGGTIFKKTSMTPEKYAELLGRKYADKGMNGQIHWEYKP